MTRAFPRLFLIALTAILVAAAPAAAQRCAAPPGTAAVDQYCENVPTVAGTGGGGSNGSSSTAKPAASTVRALERSGKSGKELNRFLGEDLASARADKRATKPGSSTTESPSRKAEPAGKAPRQPSSNPLGAVQSAVNSGATVGDSFIWVLLIIPLLIFGIVWTRSRRRSTS